MTHKRAFTLIELLVVIAIIAILAAILFPVFAMAKISAKKAVSLSNLKQHGLAVMMYAESDDDMMPPAGYIAGLDPNGNLSCYSWRYANLPYVKNVGIYASDQNPFKDTPYPNWICSWQGVPSSLPPIEQEIGIKISYAGANSWANPGTVKWWQGFSGDDQGNPNVHPNGIPMTTIPRSSSLIMVLESKYFYEDMGTWTVTWGDPAGDPGTGAFTSYSGKTNYAFFDGHSKSYNPCSTFGALNWNYGDVPPDDYMWEWWAGVDPNTLRDWLDNPSYGCRHIAEYR